MMEEQSDPSLPYRTSSRPRKTILPQRRSTRSKKPPERFSSTISLIEMEHGEREKTEEDNPSSAKIKLIRKKGKWIMNNDHEENKSNRFKSNRIGENKYKSIGHAERNINNNIEDELNNILCKEVPFSMLVPPEDEINNIFCEEVPFSTLVPPVPAEERVRVELPQPSPESFLTILDHDYGIPLPKTVRVKRHQNPQNSTKELELQDEDEVQIIREIPAKVLKINETEIKEEIEDLAETDIPSVTNKELSTTKSLNNNDNVAQNIVKEESEPENKDEVQTIGETDKNSTVQNVINTETIREFEYSNEKVQSEGSLDEVVNRTTNADIGHIVRGVGPRVEESSKVEENRQPGLDEVEEDRRHGVRVYRQQGVDELRRHQHQCVDEEEEHRRQGVGGVGDMGCCEACRRNDKIKIKMEIEMSTEQFVQVAKELPNIVTTAHVHS